MKSIELVLVHLGTRAPRHLIANLNHLVRSFPGVGVTLVSDQKSFQPKMPTGVTFHNNDGEGEATWLRTHTNLNSDFRGGFWALTLARIGALVDWHRQNADKALLHLESDMLLFEYTPLQEFSSVESLAWLRCTNESDMPGLLFSPNLERTEWLFSEIKSLIAENPNLSDMEVLFQVRRKHPDAIFELPGLPTLDELDDDLSPSSSTRAGGIFDAAGIGMWLTGEDPRNAWGWTVHFRQGAQVSMVAPASSYHYQLSGTRLQASRDNRAFDVLSLHVHSKDPRLFFVPTRAKRLARLIGRQHFGSHRELSIAGLTKVGLDYIRAGLRKFRLIFVD